MSYKLAGSYRLPYGITTSALYTALTGAPGQRTYLFRGLPQSGTRVIRLESFGAQRGPARTNLNLRGGKTFSLKGTRRLDLASDVFNVVNSNSAWSTGYASGPTLRVRLHHFAAAPGALQRCSCSRRG